MKNETELEVTRDDGEKIQLSDLSGKRKKRKNKKKIEREIELERLTPNGERLEKKIKDKSRDKIEIKEKSIDKSPDSKRERAKFLRRTRNFLYSNRFSIHNYKPIGKGSFGEIFIAIDTIDKEKRPVALKIENSKEKINQLKIEKNVLELMNGAEGFPRIYAYGSSTDKNYMAMELLGPNLFDLFEYCNHHFSLQTILLIAIQTITRIQDLHSRSGYIHRDIKPENFLIGSGGKSNVIYMIDFGLSKKYREITEMNSVSNFRYDSSSSALNEGKLYLEHIPYKEKRQLTGTARYASINNHMGIEMSRRDDLEALGYMLIFFAKKALPWQKITGEKKNEKYNKILDKKMSIPVEILCKDLPIEFSAYMNYVRVLRFNEKPDYFFLKNLFAELLFVYYLEKFYFDWNYPSPLDNPPNIRYNKDIRTDSVSEISRNKFNFNLHEDKDRNNNNRKSRDHAGSSNSGGNTNSNIKLGTHLNTLDIRNNRNLAMLNYFYGEENEESDHSSINKVINKQINEEDVDYSMDYEEEEENSEESDEDSEESDATDENSFLDGNEFLSVIESNLMAGAGAGGNKGNNRDREKFISTNTNSYNQNTVSKDLHDAKEVKLVVNTDSNNPINKKNSLPGEYNQLDNDYSSNNTILTSEYASNSHMISVPDDGRSFRSVSSNISDTYQLLNTQHKKSSTNDKNKNLLNLGNIKGKYQYQNNFNQITEDPVEEGAISHR